jgi:hypothetical protein
MALGSDSARIQAERDDNVPSVFMSQFSESNANVFGNDENPVKSMFESQKSVENGYMGVIALQSRSNEYYFRIQFSSDNLATAAGHFDQTFQCNVISSMLSLSSWTRSRSLRAKAALMKLAV